MQTSPNYTKKVTFNKFRIYENEWLESGTMLSLVFIFSLPRGINITNINPFWMYESTGQSMMQRLEDLSPKFPE